MCSNSGIPNKKFWDSIKPFLSDKGSLGNENYSLSENGQITKDEREISENFNDHYINPPMAKGGGGGECHPPTGFPNFYREWEENFLQPKFLAVGSSLG